MAYLTYTDRNQISQEVRGSAIQNKDGTYTISVEAPFNLLTPGEAERLAVLAEEAGEVVQAVGKALRHGYSESHPNGGVNNRESLLNEVLDLVTVVSMMVNAGDFPEMTDEDFVHAINARTVRKMRYAHHQKR